MGTDETKLTRELHAAEKAVNTRILRQKLTGKKLERSQCLVQKHQKMVDRHSNKIKSFKIEQDFWQLKVNRIRAELASLPSKEK